MDLTIVVSTAIINITIVACAVIWYKTVRPPTEPKPQTPKPDSAPKPPATAKQRLGRGGTFA